MKHKTLVALAIASLFAAPAVYAASSLETTWDRSVIAMTEDVIPEQSDENADLIRLPNPALIAEGDEQKEEGASQLITEGDEQKEEGTSQLIVEGDEQKEEGTSQLIVEGDEQKEEGTSQLIAEGDEKEGGEKAELIA